jgi:DNA topoisomerase-1
LNGRWGPYLAVGKQNFKLPKGVEPSSLSYEDCVKITGPLEEVVKKAASKRATPVKKAAAKKSPAAKKVTAKTSTINKKPAAKKSAAKKTPSKKSPASKKKKENN